MAENESIKKVAEILTNAALEEIQQDVQYALLLQTLRTRKNFYKKLAKKLDKLEKGEINIKDCMSEVDDKLDGIELELSEVKIALDLEEGTDEWNDY